MEEECMKEGKVELSFRKKFLIGALTGAATSVATEPLLYIKNSWQQKKPLSKNPKHFYRGLFINCAGFIPTMAIQNSVYGQIQEYLEKTDLSSLQKKTIAIATAGVASALPCTPRELLIIQQQNNGGTFYEVIKHSIKKYGFKKLLRGYQLVALKNSSFATFFFIGTPMIYDKLEKSNSHQALNALAPGLIAGSLSAALTHPIDTIKTNMQANLHSNNSIEIVKKIYTSTKKPSIRNFYRGILPRIIGVASTMTLEYNLRDFFTKFVRPF